MGLHIGDHYRTFRMLAIDPGKHFLGASIHEIDARTGRYIQLGIETLKVDKAFNPKGLSEEAASVTDRCLMKIRHHVFDLVDLHRVDFLAYESPFYNPRMPGAYGSLCEVVACIRQAALDANHSILIESMAPQHVKKGMGAGGTKGKEIMFEKVLATKELIDALMDPLEDLTEHCIDSMAIGYHARNTVLAEMEGWKL